MELRFISTDGNRIFADTTDWVVGIYYLTSEESLHRQYTYLVADFFSDYDFDTTAVFFQLDTSLTESLMLSTGLRFEERDTKYFDNNPGSVPLSPNDSLWGGRVALKYLMSDQTLVYGSVARGYKAGGFNIDLDTDIQGIINPNFDEEYLIEYEVGLKSSLFDNRLQLQLALFYDDRNNQQVRSSLTLANPDGSTRFIDFLSNAAEGTNKGIEIDLNWMISERFWLTANAGWLQAEFDDFINEFGEDLSGRDQAHAPGYMFNLTLNFEQGPFFAHVSVDGKDEFFFSDRHTVKSDSYTLYNASFGYEAEHWKLTLWGRNLGDKDYFVRAFGSFGNDPRKFYVTEPYFQFGEPRISGVTLEFMVGG